MKLIDKDAVVKEIERRENESWNLLPNASDVIEDKYSKEDAIIIGEYNALESLEKFINTLEVKEVDLGKEIQAFVKMELEPIKIYDANVSITITMHQLYQCAKHFFELGLKVNQKGE